MSTPWPYKRRDNEFIAWYPTALLATSGMDIWTRTDAAFYIHFPFCKCICDYCGFSVESYAPSRVARYLEALAAEIRLHDRRPVLASREFTVGHFGGGTPSLLEVQQVELLLAAVNDVISLSHLEELTLEANPISFTLEKARGLRSLGFNRISLGVQTFNEELLKSIGRPHRKKDTMSAYAAARKAGFENISLDLMYLLPNQSMRMLIDDLERAIQLEPDHITCFALEQIPMTPLDLKLRLGQVKTSAPSFEEQMAMHMKVEEVLNASGYVHYGCLSYTRNAKESKHNKIAFQSPQAEYIGWGNSAYSFFNGWTFCNDCNIDRYCRAIESGKSAVVLGRKANQLELASRFIILGLKFFFVPRTLFIQEFGVPMEFFFNQEISKLCAAGLLSSGQDGLRVTDIGRIFINNVCKEFYVDENRGKSQHPQFEPTISAERINRIVGNNP